MTLGSEMSGRTKLESASLSCQWKPFQVRKTIATSMGDTLHKFRVDETNDIWILLHVDSNGSLVALEALDIIFLDNKFELEEFQVQTPDKYRSHKTSRDISTNLNDLGFSRVLVSFISTKFAWPTRTHLKGQGTIYPQPVSKSQVFANGYRRFLLVVD